MGPGEIVEALEREQRDTLALWRSLRDDEWERPSLCRGWTVKDVLIHTIRGERELFQPTVRRVAAGEAVAPEGFDLEGVNAQQIMANRSRAPADLLDEAGQTVEETSRLVRGLAPEDFERASWNPIVTATLGFYVKGRIWEWWVHNQDVRIPLKRSGAREPERTRAPVEVVRDGIASVFRPDRAAGVRASYAFRVGDAAFTVRIDDGACRVEDGFDRKATTRIVADPATFVLVSMRRIPQWKAVLTRRFKATGNPIAGMRFLSYFASP